MTHGAGAACLSLCLPLYPPLQRPWAYSTTAYIIVVDFGISSHISDNCLRWHVTWQRIKTNTKLKYSNLGAPYLFLGVLNKCIKVAQMSYSIEWPRTPQKREMPAYSVGTRFAFAFIIKVFIALYSCVLLVCLGFFLFFWLLPSVDYYCICLCMLWHVYAPLPTSSVTAGGMARGR